MLGVRLDRIGIDVFVVVVLEGVRRPKDAESDWSESAVEAVRDFADRSWGVCRANEEVLLENLLFNDRNSRLCILGSTDQLFVADQLDFHPKTPKQASPYRTTL